MNSIKNNNADKTRPRLRPANVSDGILPVEQVGHETILIALAQLIAGKIAHELYAAFCGRNITIAPHDLASMKPTRDTVDLSDFAVVDANSKPDVAHAVETYSPLSTDSLVKSKPRRQH